HRRDACFTLHRHARSEADEPRLRRRVACAIPGQSSKRPCREVLGVDTAQDGPRKSEVALRSRGVTTILERARMDYALNRPLQIILAGVLSVTTTIPALA